MAGEFQSAVLADTPAALNMPLISIFMGDVHEASGRTLCKETGDNIEVRLKVGSRFMVAGAPGLTLQLGKLCGEDDVIRIEVMQTTDILAESPKSDSAPTFKLLGFTEIPLQGLASSLQLNNSKSWEGMMPLRRGSAFCWTPFTTASGTPKIQVRLVFDKSTSASAGEQADSEVPTPVEYVGSKLDVEGQDEFVPSPKSRCREEDNKHAAAEDNKHAAAPVHTPRFGKSKSAPVINESAGQGCSGLELICQKLQARNMKVSQSMNELPLPGCPRCTQRLKFTTEYPAHYPPGGVRCHVCGHSVAIYGGFFLCTASSSCRFDMCWECHEKLHEHNKSQKCPVGHDSPAHGKLQVQNISEKCPQGHELIPFRTPVPDFICDKCDLSVSQGEYTHQCRICNYDVCQRCIHQKDYGAAERVTCPKGHHMEISSVKDIKCERAVDVEATNNPGERTVLVTRTQTVCDMCELELSPGSKSYSCRACNYDACQKCVNSTSGLTQQLADAKEWMQQNPFSLTQQLAVAKESIRHESEQAPCPTSETPANPPSPHQSPPSSRVAGSLSTTSLPFSKGSSQYQGFVYHPLLSRWKLQMNLVVKQQNGPADFVGQWTAMGQVENITIKVTGDTTITMFNTQGVQITLLQGTVDSARGILAGSLEQNGHKGGSFELHPLTLENP